MANKGILIRSRVSSACSWCWGWRSGRAATPTTTTTGDTAPPTTAGSTAAATTHATATTADFVPLPDVPGVTDDEIRFAAFGTQLQQPARHLRPRLLRRRHRGLLRLPQRARAACTAASSSLTTVLDDELAQQPGSGRSRSSSADDTFGAFSATQFAERLGRPRRRRHPALRLGHPLRRDGRPGQRSSATSACCARPAPAASVAATPPAGRGARRSPRSATASAQNSKDCAAGAARTSIEIYGDDIGARGRLHQRRPGLRPAQRHRPRGHGHEGRRRRLHHRPASTSTA